MKDKFINLWRKLKRRVRLQWLHFKNRYTPKQRKRIYWLSAALLLLLTCVGGFLIWYNQPTQQAHRLETAQSRLMHKQKNHIVDHPHGHYTYGLGAGVPSLHQMAKERKMTGHHVDIDGNWHNRTGDGNSHDDNDTHEPTLRGQVSLPRYGIDVPVFEGTSLSTLAWGAGTARPDEEMGHNNFAIEAHNFSKLWDADDVCPNWFFSNFEKQVVPAGDINLENVKPKLGTQIFALNSKYVYKYVLVKKAIVNKVNPTSGWYLSNPGPVKKLTTNGHTPTITMATCYEQWGILFPNQRIVLVGQLVSKTPRSQTNLSNKFKDV